MTRRPLLALLALPLVFALAGCNPGNPAPDGSGTSTPSDDPSSPPDDGSPNSAPLVLPADAVLLVQTVATAENGATMDLALIVHKSTAWDDPAASDRPALLTAGCEGGYDESIYADQLFSFATIDVTATATSGTWPTDGSVETADDVVYVFPGADYLSLASTGFLLEESTFDSSTPHCRRGRVIDGSGEGTIVVGFRGDTDDVGAAGGYTRWANHNYGFTVDGTNMTLTDCSVTVTPLGEEFGWSEADAGTFVTDQFCRFGVAEGEDSDS